MNRFDLSTNLIHLTKGDTLNACFETLHSILKGRRLLGGVGYIRGGSKCICLSEAPISAIGSILDNPLRHNFRYRPFGLVLDKNWFFQQGGRPVIYQPETEYDNLPENLQYRHVTYNPIKQPIPIDFTWEREWRLCAEFLELDPEKCSVVIPKRSWINPIQDFFEKQGMIDLWTFIALEDLGVIVDVPE